MKSYYEKNNKNEANVFSGGFHFKVDYEINKIEFLDETKIKIDFRINESIREMDIQSGNRMSKGYWIHNFIIDISKVEKISWGWLEAGSGPDGILILKFKFKKNYSEIINVEENKIYGNGLSIKTENRDEVYIPIAGLDDFDISESHDQIFKAFNHFRKLCGAPEPIKFD